MTIQRCVCLNVLVSDDESYTVYMDKQVGSSDIDLELLTLATSLIPFPSFFFFFFHHISTFFSLSYLFSHSNYLRSKYARATIGASPVPIRAPLVPSP